MAQGEALQQPLRVHVGRRGAPQRPSGGERNWVLVVVGATFDRENELLAITNGIRESEASWKEILLDLKKRGMSEDPKPAIADGALGFRKAPPQVFPSTRTHRCWLHETANVLNKLPKSMHPSAKTLIRDIHQVPTEEAAVQAFDHFCETYGDKYPRAVECLERDREVMPTFCAFPDRPPVHRTHGRTFARRT